MANMDFITKITDKSISLWKYLWSDVWSDTRNNWYVGLIKTLNLTVKSFLNAKLQSQAAALTYHTILALVPALAILFAIGRGFGFHKILETQLFNYIPAQKETLDTVVGFVDAYLAQSSQGIFVGIGVVLLLWTMISLMSNIESAFNSIWGIKQGRSILRMITDYTAMLLILPILMICSSGLSLFMTSTLQNLFAFEFMSPIISILLKCASYIFTWLFFAAMFMLIPNTKVKFKNALIAGIFTGTGFLILQWIFVSGQMYVSKYNAIYGSFSLLPLLLIWLQFSWIIILSGIAICYSSQSIYRFNFSDKINQISDDYRTKITLAIMCVITKHFANEDKAITLEELTTKYDFPSRISIDIVERLIDANLVVRVIRDKADDALGFQPSSDINKLSIAFVLDKLNRHGVSGFIPNFDNTFKNINSSVDNVIDSFNSQADTILLKDIDIKTNNN
ncbi:MAG: YihY/virulence factor BrkB family protein [Muribaculaceae bacterium]|nr:YihY/virulence factor BrkB family protein [Muribaculaceae bacterium]